MAAQYALVHVELENHVSAEKRKKFDDAMKADKWTKLKDPYTTWKGHWADILPSAAVTQTKKEVAAAAAAAGISKYEAVVHVGPQEPTTLSS